MTQRNPVSATPVPRAWRAPMRGLAADNTRVRTEHWEHSRRRTLPTAAALWILAGLFLMVFFGSVSDYLGRLPVIITALVFSERA